MKRDFDIGKIMFFSILTLILSVMLLGVLSGGLKQGIVESTRNSRLRWNYMQQVLKGFDEDDDEYKVIYSGEKQGRAYVVVQFNNMDWDRTARNDLYGILDKQGWKEKNGGLFCKDGASLKTSGNVAVLDSQDYTQLLMEYSSVSIYECG